MIGSTELEFLDAPVREGLNGVDAAIARALDSDNTLIREVADYLQQPGGKKLRPAIAILAARASGREPDEDVINLAASLEIFHIATLLHDDVIDEAMTRRGRPSVNAKWSNSVAILMADFLYAQSFDLSLTSLKPEILRVLCQVTAKMCEGEMFQIQKEGKILTREDYLHIIKNKTAYLFSACAALGGIVAGASTMEAATLGEFGLNFGMAFQLTDDTLDYTADHARWGKIIGGDIANGKQTLPLIYTLENATPADREEVLRHFRNGAEPNFPSIFEHVKKYNGLEHAIQAAQDYAGRATRSLANWRGEGDAQPLFDLCEYVVARSF